MEAAGLASSIITFLDLAAKVVSRAHEYIVQGENAPKFLRTIETHLPLLAKSLETTKRQALDRKVSSEIAAELVDIVNNALAELQRLDQYIRMLKPSDRSSSFQKLDRAVKSVFKYDTKIQTAMEKLRGYTDTLNFYQVSVSTGKTDSILRYLRSIKYDQSELVSQYQRDSIKQWIAGPPRDDYIDACISSMEKRTSKVLWIHGPPGFGKTFLSATIFSRMEEGGDLAAAVFWTSEGQFANSPLDEIPRSWLAQLLAQDVSLFERLKAVWTASRSERASSKEVWHSLKITLGASANPITLVIDGLDEYQQQQARRRERAGFDHQSNLQYVSIREFLQKLKSILGEVHCRLLLVSQQEAEIQAEYAATTLSAEGLEGYEHNIVQEDVKQDVKAFASFMIEGKIPKKTDSLKADLTEMIVSKAEGQMLWVALQQRESNYLRPSFSEKKLRSVIERTPVGLDHLYQSNLDRIDQLPANDKLRALRLLHWVMHALRALSVHELVEAILIEDNNDAEEFPDEELPEDPNEEDVFGEIKTLCGNFITFDIDEKQKQPQHWKVRLAHSSVRVFLAEKLPADIYGEIEQGNDNEVSRSVIGNLCLHYLTYGNIWPEPQSEIGPNSLTAPAHPLLTYAATYWPMHLTGNNRDDMRSGMSTFFRNHYDKFQKWQKASLETKDFAKAGLAEKTMWHWLSRLSFAAALGVEGIVEELCDLGDEVDPDGAWPLSGACYSGSLPTVQLLIDRGAQLERTTPNGMTPVKRAAAKGRFEIVDFLIKKGASVNTSSNDGFSPLHSAARNGFEEVVKLLLAAGADPLKLDNNGCFPLHYGVNLQQQKVVAALLTTDAVIKQTINYISYSGWAPLSSAAYFGDLEIVKILLSKGADALQIGVSGKTPLFHSAERGHSDVFMLLFQTCGNVSDVVNKVTEVNGYSLLHAAVYGKSLEIVKTLMENGADISRPDNGYRSAFDWSIYLGLKEVVGLLLQSYVNFDLTSYMYTTWTPLMYAAESGFEDMVQMLLDRGVEVQVRNEDNSTALDIAASNGHASIVKLLLDHVGGRDVLEIRRHSGYTPLLATCEAGHAEVVKILLDAGADSSAKSTRGASCLDMAAFSGSLETVQTLLDRCGASAFSDTLVLHCAAESGEKALFDLLHTHYKINLETWDSGWTVLHGAAQGGNEEIIKLILDEGPKNLLTTRDNKEHLSLYLACESSKVDAARLLLQAYAQCVPPLNFDTDDVFASVSSGDLEIVKLLYKTDTKRFKDAQEKGTTPLHIACLYGKNKIMEFLIAHGYNVLDKNEDGESCIHLYALSGYAEIAKYFNSIDWSEALAARSTHGRTPLLDSCYRGKADAFRRFIRHGANVADVTDHPWNYSRLLFKGLSTLHYAAASGSIEIAKLILETYDRHLKLKTARGVQPIHVAAIADHDFMIEFLMEHGASAEVATIHDETPLFLSVCFSSRLSVATLLKVGMGPFEKQQGLPIMAYAALDDTASSMKLLHADGFDLVTGQKDGQTLLHLAASKAAEDSIDFLLDQKFDWEVKDDHGWSAKDCMHVSKAAQAPDASPDEVASLSSTWLPPTVWAFDSSGITVFKMDGHATRAVLQTAPINSDPEAPPTVFTLTADHYLLPKLSASYFEVTIEECAPSNGVAVGLDCFIGEHKRTLGLGYRSYAYYGEDGNFGDTTYETDEYGPPFKEGDTIGCGVDYHAQQLFFTKNGKCLGIACYQIRGRFVPAISTIEQVFKVDANFGQRDFSFDIMIHGYGNNSCEKCYGTQRYRSEWRTGVRE